MGKQKQGKDPLLRVGAVAARLALSRQRVYQLAEVGALRSLMIGRALRFDAQDVENFIEQNKRGPRSAA